MYPYSFILIFNRKSTKTNSQIGFRKQLATSHAISNLHNDILIELDEKLKVRCIFLDLATAFDTIDQKILLQKLY